MQEHNLTVDFKARYYSLGQLSDHTRQIWFVLHGYGQLARYFIRKFAVLTEQHILVIAPEGLSRFYLEKVESSGRANDRVGATWMTKENRTVDIENYLHYLNAVADLQTGKGNPIPVTLLGFSQGAATASRWAISGRIKFQRLILWSGVFPPDLDLESGKALQEKEVMFVYGKSDPYLNDTRLVEMDRVSSTLKITPRVESFEGGHEIDEQTLLKIA